MSGFPHYAKVDLENENNCCCTELLFEQADPDCVFQVVQTIYEGGRADFVLRIFGNDKDGYSLEVEMYSATGEPLEMVADDLIGIHSVFRQISEKYDLAAKPLGCEIKPYYRHLIPTTIQTPASHQQHGF